MGLEMESDCEKKSTVGLSPNTVLPSKHNCPVPKKRTTKLRSSRRDELLVLKGEFREISFSRYRSVSCKSAPSSRRISQECGAEFRRGSIYQTSGEARRMRDMGASEERRKIEISRGSDNPFSIFNSLCSSGEENLKRRSMEPSSVASPRVRPDSSDEFFEICLDPGSRGNNAAETMGREALDSNLRSDPVVGPLNNGNELPERDAAKASLNKSVSAKVEMPSSPSVYKSDCLSKASSKTRFGPIRKMFDPFTKSKSSHNPLGSAAEPGEKQSKTCSMSSLHDISERALLCETQFLKSKNQSILSASPVHLHGYLKVENKHGLPFFEFSLQCPEDVFVAKTWKAKDAFNWVYTFHSADGGEKSNASRSGLFDSDKECSMVGQMQVSCYLCSELKDGTFDNSMVTEFVLYDIAHARLRVSSQENSTTCNPSDNIKSAGEALGSDERTRTRDFDSSDSYPWAAENLCPSLEIAAVVMQAPFEKRESLKHKRGDNKSHDKTHQNLLNLSMVEPVKQNPSDTRSSPDKVKVVIPAGNHGLPSSESGPGNPSSLLDRWRLGGGCDCGGWDMACPLTVLGNPNFRCANNSQSLVEDQMPMELFVLGNKDNTAALTMTVIEEGLYAVDFHAQLSTLQAFSVCVAILHGTETSSDVGDERDQKLPQGNSLKVLMEEEVKFLIEAVAAGKKSVTKRVKEIPPSYVLNPPLSPIARV